MCYKSWPPSLRPLPVNCKICGQKRHPKKRGAKRNPRARTAFELIKIMLRSRLQVVLNPPAGAGRGGLGEGKGSILCILYPIYLVSYILSCIHLNLLSCILYPQSSGEMPDDPLHASGLCPGGFVSLLCMYLGKNHKSVIQGS